MESNETTRVDQDAPEEGSSAVAAPKRRKPGRPPGSKNKKTAGKKKASKKKTGKKRNTKKKTTKKKTTKKVGKKAANKKLGSKKVSKKKTSKKKRGKKKATASVASGDSMSRLLAAVEELREAVVHLATEKAQEQQTAVSDLRQAAKARIAEIEDATLATLKKLGF